MHRREQNSTCQNPFVLYFIQFLYLGLVSYVYVLIHPYIQKHLFALQCNKLNVVALYNCHIGVIIMQVNSSN